MASSSFFDDAALDADETQLPVAGPSRVIAARQNARALQQRTSVIAAAAAAYTPHRHQDLNPDMAPRSRQPAQARRPRHMSVDLDNDDDHHHGMTSKGKQRATTALDDVEIDVGRDRESLLQELTRHWMDERLAPELLYWRGPLVCKIMQNLGSQIEAADTLANDPKHHEMVLLVQTEIERVRYILRSYLRVRLSKVEKFAQYLVTTPTARRKLSTEEWHHAERYDQLVQKHLATSVLQNLPERLARLDEPDMIQKPDLDAAVFAQGRRDCPLIRLPDGQELEIQKGNTHMLRYRSIRRLLRDGDVRLV